MGVEPGRELMNLSTLGEFGLIQHLSQKLQTRAGVSLGIGDDAAVLQTLQTPIVTCDCLVENVHFRRDWTTPFLLGRKALSVNLSDCAAMGARPVAAFVALVVGENVDLLWLDELYRGLESVCADFDFTLAGGDTSRGAQTVLSVTLLGDAPNPVLRSGAQVGDVLLVTGTLGDSAAGLQILLAETVEETSRILPQVSAATREDLLSRHFDPTPRLREMNVALMIQNHGERVLHAALDLSDGLAGDARHIANRSGVTLEINADALPISPQSRDVAALLGTSAQEWALRGGEDYELLMCVAPRSSHAVAQSITAATNTLVTAVGRVVPREAEPVITIANGERQAARGAFEHF